MFNLSIKIVLICLCLACLGRADANPPIFANTPEDAFALSEDLNIDLLLVFGASWCVACVNLKNDLNSNLDVIEDTIVCYVDYDKRTDMAKEYMVKTLPSYFLYRKRTEKKRGSGYQGLAKFRKWLDNGN